MSELIKIWVKLGIGIIQNPFSLPFLLEFGIINACEVMKLRHNC